LFVLFSFLKLNAQTYNYSYTDPCTGNIKNLIVPINGSVTVGYYGFVENFTQQQFTDGTFDTWTNQVFSQYDGSPCAEIIGLGGQINIGQDVALNTIGIINSLSSLMDISNGATDFLSGSLNAASNSSNTKGSKGGKKNGNNSQNGSGNNTTNTNTNTTTNTNNTTTNNNQNQTNGTSNPNGGSTTTSGTNETNPNNGGNGTTNPNGGTQNPTSAGGTSTEGGSNANGNSQASQPINNQNQGNENNGNNNSSVNLGGTGVAGNSGNVEGSNQQGQEVNGGTTTPNGGGNSGVNGNGGNQPNSEETTPKEEQGGGQTNITQGATKTINQNKEGGKPTVIASSDFVGFNFQNSEVRTGLKLTGGYHNMRWDGETARGGLVDYVSAQQGPNMTGYHAWINKRSVGLLSGTLSLGFEGRGSVYGTIAGGQMFMFPKIPSLKAVYMGTVSYGQVYKTQFLGTAMIAGGMYDLKFGKRIDVKLMSLFVYSPYVSYYNDLVLKSPYVILPSIGTNISITKRFKFNINAGGAWAIKVNTLNYTITCGTRLLVGQ
jgi:hypothetical protein